MSSLIRLPLIIAAVVVVVRVVLEQIGASSALNQVFGVAWLYLLVPIYFGVNLAAVDSPYKSLFKTLLCFVAYTRVMVMATYIAAYHFQWPAARFSVEGGGVVGEGVTALQGLLVIPRSQSPDLDRDWYPGRDDYRICRRGGKAARECGCIALIPPDPLGRFRFRPVNPPTELDHSRKSFESGVAAISSRRGSSQRLGHKKTLRPGDRSHVKFRPSPAHGCEPDPATRNLRPATNS